MGDLIVSPGALKRIPNLEEAYAIIINGDTAPQAIGEEQYVYVRNHSTLNYGLYTATSAIASGAALSSSNLSPVPEGGLNALFDKISSNGVDVAVTIPASGWSSSSPYVYTWTDARVTSRCRVMMDFVKGANNGEVPYLDIEKVSGGVKFTAPSKPTQDISVTLHIINAIEQSITNVSAADVATSAVDGAANVEEALAEHESSISTDHQAILKLQEQTVADGAGAHNAIYRGKFLGTSVSAAQYAQISAGTFNDLFVGDYWTIGGQDWVICDFDYYYRCGSTDITKHHIVVMPRSAMSIPEGTALYGKTNETLTLLKGDDVTYKESATAFKWNGTAADPNTHTTVGGYKFSRMRQVVMRAANTIVIGLFGASHVEPITVLYPDPASDASGLASGWVWYDQAAGNDKEKSICDLLNETQVYGQQVWGLGSAFGNQGYEIGIDKFQLAIFAHNRNFANIRASWWLRSVSSATRAARVTYDGYANDGSAADTFGVRPRFLLVG